MDEPRALPKDFLLHLQLVNELRYGENPHQKAGWYLPVGAAVPFKKFQGKELSFTNLLDLEAARRIVSMFPDTPAACVIKHTNPCGVATAKSLKEAYKLARDADQLSAFGGIVGLNGTLDRMTAEEITSTFVECVIAPIIDGDALITLRNKPNLRVIADLAPLTELEMREALGGVLIQQVDRVEEALTEWGPGLDGLKVVTKRQPTPEEWIALRFAWRVCAPVKSNAVVLTMASQTGGIGGGQSNRVGSAKIATGALSDDIVDRRGCVAASDAFFPFRDGLDVVAKAGATAVVQPGGSQKDPEVIAAADEHGMAMVFTGRRHFRH